jgi:hypothetical protein
MPKVDGTQVGERLQIWLDKLLRGEAVAPRDLRGLLSQEQRAAIDAAWAEQQKLRGKMKKPKTVQAQIQAGWKEKRDIHIEVLRHACAQAKTQELAAWNKRMLDADVRQGRIFFDELGAALDAGVDMQTAKTRANNALTRAGLRRLDGQQIGMQGLSARDREIRAMEDAILQRAESEINDYEREQLELVREYEKAVLENRKKRGL